MRKSLVRSWEFGVCRRNLSASNSWFRTYYLLTIVVLCALSVSGCVRVAGGAGYYHKDSEGDVKSKKVGFDTADYVPGSPAPGKITVN